MTQCVCVHERDLEQLCVHHDTLYCMYNGAMYWGGLFIILSGVFHPQGG